MLEIDGSMGEGGGQVLRTSLTLSVLTGKAIRVIRMRAKRSKPGLREQHRIAVQAAASVSGARVEGARLGSKRLTFHPEGLRSGDYRFRMETAGSCSLVLQTIFLPLSVIAEPSRVEIQGGTHVPWSPCFHFLQMHWLPLMQRCGYRGDLELDQAGFYPRGGGCMRARIQAGVPGPGMNLTSSGPLLRVRGVSAVSNLPLTIAQRQRDQALRRLEHLDCPLEIHVQQAPAMGKGTFLLLQAECEKSQGCFTALGELGKPAERVADEAVEQMLAFLSSGAGTDKYLADQLLLPLALAREPSSFTTSCVTQHLLTNAAVIEAFGVASITVRGDVEDPGSVQIKPRERP